MKLKADLSTFSAAQMACLAIFRIIYDLSKIIGDITNNVYEIIVSAHGLVDILVRSQKG